MATSRTSNTRTRRGGTKRRLALNVPPDIKRILWAGLALYVPFMAAVFLGVITFTSWPQVELLHNARVDLEVLSRHPHFFRYLTARPGLLLADRFGDVGFSLYIAHLALGSILLLSILLRKQPIFLIVGAGLAVFAIQMLMNGRGVISWFGWTFILALFFESRDFKLLCHLPAFGLALLCTSVSSGTFSVAFTSVLAFTFAQTVLKKSWTFAVIFAATLVSFWGLFVQGLERNLSYFTLGTRNPIMNMLRHGAGDIVLEHPILIIGGLLGVLALGVVGWSMAKRKPDILEWIVLLVPIAGGAFGYTTLTLLLPSVLTVFGRRIQRKTPRRAMRRAAHGQARHVPRGPQFGGPSGFAQR